MPIINYYAKGLSFTRFTSRNYITPRKRVTPVCSFHMVSINQSHFVGNKAKGRISKRVFQESKARQIFRRTDISYPLIRTRTQGVRNVCFSGNLACFAFLKPPLWDSRFCRITDDLQVVIVNHLQFQVLEICNKYKKSVKGQVQACWTNMFRNHCWRQQKFLNFTFEKNVFANGEFTARIQGPK